MASRLEDRFLLLCRLHGVPMPDRECRLLTPRRYRTDFCRRDDRLVVEVEGGIWSRGRHTRAAGYQQDVEKYNLLTLAGWRVLRVTAAHLQSGQAMEWVTQALQRGVR